MPANGTIFYQLLSPTQVGSQPGIDQSHRAVNYGVQAIQRYINQLYALVGHAPILANGIFGPSTKDGVVVAQYLSRITIDGVFGPQTATAFFWPTLKRYAPDPASATIMGGICHLESGFDPGAVGFEIPQDLGLAQINLPSNPTVKEPDAFAPTFALHYLVNRVKNALAAFTNQDAAIVSYNNPSWAEQWEQTGHAPTPAAQTYVNLVRAWKPPS